MSVHLELRDQDVLLRCGDEVSVNFNPAGQNGYLVDCFVGFDRHDNALTWNLDGTSMDGTDLDIVEIA